MCLSKGVGFSFITDENIDVRQDLVNLALEELRDKGCGQVHGECLLVWYSERGQLERVYNVV